MFGTQMLTKVNYTTCACVADNPGAYERDAVHSAFKWLHRKWVKACREGHRDAQMYKMRANQIWAYLGRNA